MKILAIRGCNIASLEGEFEIDFTKEPLLSSGIYAITGPTGAGKSSILDTLSLALYENTPRLSKAGETKINDIKESMVGTNHPSTLLRRGAVEAFAEVDFIANDGDIYRSRWSVRRAHLRADRPIQNANISLRNLSKNTEFPERKKGTLSEICRLIGLTYEQFTRTVLLAQGEFAVFLKANDSERASLLEKLTGTSIYSQISAQIYVNNDQAKRAYEELQMRMKEHHLLSDEEFEQQQNSLNDINLQIRLLDQEHQEGIKQINWFLDEEKYITQIKEATSLLDKYLILEESEKENKLLLLKIEAVYPSFLILREKKRLENELTKVDIQLDSLLKLISQKNQELSSFTLILNHAEKKLADFLIGEELFLQKMRKARDYASQLKSEEESILREQEQIRFSKNSIQEKEQQILSCKKNISEWQQNIDTSDIWLKNNIERKEVAENQQLIMHHLSSGSSYYLKLSGLNKDLQIEGEKKSAIQKTLVKETDSSHKIQDTLSLLKQQEVSGQHELLKTDISKLKHELENQTQLRRNMTDLIRLWNKLEPAKKEIKNNEIELNRLSEFLNSYPDKYTEFSQNYTKQEAAYKQEQKSFSRLQQIMSENVSSLRANLQPQTPCPVCGSLDHPYQQESNDQFKNLLLDSEAELERLKKMMDLTFAALAELKHQQTTALQREAQIQQINQQLLSEITLMSDQWTQNPLSAVYPLSNTSLSEKLFLEVINQADVCIDQYNSMISSFEQKQIALNNLQNQIQDLEKKHNDSRLIIATEQERLDASEKSERVIRNMITEITDALNKELVAVDAYFKSPTWRENWLQDPNDFISKMNAFAIKWNENLKMLDEANGQIKQLKSNWAIEEQNLQVLKEKLSKEQIAEKINQDRVLFIRKELDTLLEGKSLSEIEKSYKDEKGKLTKLRDDENVAVRQLKESLAILEGQNKQLTQQKDLLISDLSKVGISFKEWLSAFNATHTNAVSEDQILEWMAIPAEFIAQKKKELDGINLEILKCRNSLEILQANLSEHQLNKPAGKGKEEIESYLAGLKEKRERLDQDRLGLASTLGRHQENIRILSRMNAELEDKRKTYLNWSRLNAEIGKADGAKFKNIAQGYTLDLLLNIANVHIRDIAPRYRLQRIPESLSLQVIDRDMCDQIRSVHSLSGGETFLVSLSLALGLSSLSSRQMNIESLFIDEGFGSLDEDSLLTAMEALDSLRLQGRKVGVITHVKEMTERIPTRIHVIKQHNGASHIRIE